MTAVTDEMTKQSVRTRGTLTPEKNAARGLPPVA